MAVRVRPSSRLMSDDLPTLERPEKAICRIPFADSGCAWPTCPMAPANSTDLILSKRSTRVREVRKYENACVRFASVRDARKRTAEVHTEARRNGGTENRIFRVFSLFLCCSV